MLAKISTFKNECFMDLIRGTATFVIPHFADNQKPLNDYLDKAITSLINQTDDNWRAIIVDDMSSKKGIIDYLDKIKSKAPDRIHYIIRNSNDGPGIARNVGIEWAYRNNSPIVLFLDADDISHHKRLEVVRKIMGKDDLVSVVYSTFEVIDENDDKVPFEKLTGSIQEILEGHENPIEGYDAWIEIGTRKGYINLTSATSVRTELAFNCPFPPERVSEDSYTWLLYSVKGEKFIYSDEIKTLYRIVQTSSGSATRSVHGRLEFYKNKCRVDCSGFLKALEIALNKGKINREKRNELAIRFYIKLAETMKRENCPELAIEQIEKARVLDTLLFNKYYCPISVVKSL
ncbi:glycosyltransferase family 2 protein [Maribacter sp. 2307UL18-2]|uniref:glycosyltransferase family 2 protein n=1 Tax=Maribacter sp. 2307UL18-2 TaxID=3386274 RepID=UPI0039BD22BD